VFEQRKKDGWLMLCLATLGLAYAFYSSLPIRDPSSALFGNDEGLYLSYGARGAIMSELRYGLFSLLVRIYFLIVSDPFWVAVLHKSLSLAAFLLFQPMLVRKYGYRPFVLLYLAFSFLNGHFLRDGLIFLFVLLAVSCADSGSLIRRYLAQLPLVLIRPQALLLFFPLRISVILVAYFFLFMRHLYAAEHPGIDMALSEGNIHLIKTSTPLTLITLANINPLASLNFHLNNGSYLEACLTISGSFCMFLVFAQMTLALRWTQYRHTYIPRLWMGAIGILIMYGSIEQTVDKRVFISLFSPFIIFVNPTLIRGRTLVWLVGVWVAMLIIRMLFGNTG